MSRRLVDPVIEVRTTSACADARADARADIAVRTIEVRRFDGGDTVGEPTQFLWRGRLYVIRGILARWVEAGSWWLRSGVQPGAAEREVWRVEATPTRGSTGVYDLVYDVGQDHWALARVVD
jgi:hypothetical protein